MGGLQANTLQAEAHVLLAQFEAEEQSYSDQDHLEGSPPGDGHWRAMFYVIGMAHSMWAAPRGS